LIAFEFSKHDQMAIKSRVSGGCSNDSLLKRQLLHLANLLGAESYDAFLGVQVLPVVSAIQE
jgi:hypothetical protein